MTLEVFTKLARPFDLPYRCSGSDLLQSVHGRHGGLILCGSHAFPLNRLVQNYVRDLGLVPVRVVRPENILLTGNLWGRGDPVETVQVTPHVLLRVARHLQKGSVVIILPDYVDDEPTAISTQIFDFAKSFGFPILFFATWLADDWVPEVAVEAPPHPLLTSTTDRDLCIEAYRTFRTRYADNGYRAVP